MKLFRKAVTMLLSLLLVFPISIYIPSATDGDASVPSESYIFVDGENITRRINTVVVYYGKESTGQTQWGHNIVLSPDGMVTSIIEGGAEEGYDLAIPQDGAVVSASGVTVDWFRSNVQIGSKLYYDRFTHRLFLCDESGIFDPYFSKTVNISGEGDKFMITNPLINGTPPYLYSVAVNSEGTVISNGIGTETPELGFIITAATKADREFLMMYAPIGAKCVVSGNVATFSYDATMLSKTVNLSISDAKTSLEEAKSSYLYVDVAAAEQFILQAEQLITATNAWDYFSASAFASSLESEISSILSYSPKSEMRSAFHTPTETNADEVLRTVKAFKESGLNTIIIRITNGYDTIIPMPYGSKFDQNPDFNGFDVLKSYISACKQENIALSVCIDVYYNKFASIAESDWLSEVNGTDIGASERFFSPANPDFKEYYLEYISHIVKNYDIGSIFFDYLRYPKFHEGCDLGYDYLTTQGFCDITDIPLQDINEIGSLLFDSPYWEQWVNYKMGLVSDMAKSISETVRAIRPEATLIAVTPRDSVDYYYMQDSISWIEEGVFDGLCVSVYNGDTAEKDEIDEIAYYSGIIESKGNLFGAYTGDEKYLFMGIESSYAYPSDVIANAVTESRSAAADGFVFSSFADYIAQGYASGLKTSVLKDDSASPFADKVQSIKYILEYSKDKITNHLLANGYCDEASALAACGKINEALAALNEGGMNLEQAEKLQNDIALIFATSEVKSVVLEEFQAITKRVLLTKEASADNPDSPDDTPDAPDESDTPSPDESTDTDTEVSENTAGNTSEATDERFSLNIDMGSILIYGFVSIAAIAAVVLMVIAVKKKNTKPKNHHMPKGFEEKDSE